MTTRPSMNRYSSRPHTIRLFWLPRYSTGHARNPTGHALFRDSDPGIPLVTAFYAIQTQDSHWSRPFTRFRPRIPTGHGHSRDSDTGFPLVTAFYAMLSLKGSKVERPSSVRRFSLINRRSW
eukprot:1295374-Amorphochlora_amoeboformis.AAC.1